MTYKLIILDRVKDFISSLPKAERGKILHQIERLVIGDFSTLYVKTLRKQIKELIVRDYRLVFFIESGHAYFVSAFLKKTQKTPKHEIDLAEKNYKQVFKNN